MRPSSLSPQARSPALQSLRWLEARLVVHLLVHQLVQRPVLPAW
jgi:hypothetical protein